MERLKIFQRAIPLSDIALCLLSYFFSQILKLIWHQKIFQWVGIIAQLAALFLTLFGSGEGFMFLLILCLLFGLGYPVIKYLDTETNNYREGIFTAIGTAVAVVILAAILKDSGNFIDSLFSEITTQGFMILYLVTLALADYYAPKGKCWAVGLAIGALLPLLLMFIIAVVILLALLSGGKIGSGATSSLSSSSSSSRRNETGGGDGFGTGPRYYCIWTDGNTVLSKMPSGFHFQCDHEPSYAEVEEYMRVSGWRNCHVLLVKRAGSNDSVLNYLNDLKATYGDRSL